MTDMAAFVVGDRVWYVIRGVDNVPPIWLAVLVVHVTATRVGVRAGRSRVRYVSPARLTTDPPPAGVTTIDARAHGPCACGTEIGGNDDARP